MSSTTHAADAAAREILALLPQAVFTFDADLVMNPIYSLATVTLFGGRDNLEGCDVLELLATDVPDGVLLREQMQAEFSLVFGATSLQWEMSAPRFPRRIKKVRAGVTTTHRLTYQPLFDAGGKLIRVLLVVDDITDMEETREEIEQRQEELARIAELVAINDQVFTAFTDDATRIFEACDQEVAALQGAAPQESLVLLMRHVHTLKGCAGLFNLTRLHALAHAVEDDLARLREAKGRLKNEDVQAVQVGVEGMKSEVAEYERLRTEVLGRGEAQQSALLSRGHLLWLLSLLSRTSQALRTPNLGLRDVDSLIAELRRAVAGVGKTHFKHYARRYDQLLAKLAHAGGKKVAPLKVSGNYQHYDARILNKISDLLVHCLGNAIDHGIESPQERLAAGKPAAGSIHITSELEDNVIEITITDDGGGIDTDRIRERALALGLVTPKKAKKMSREDWLLLIFEPGFSTARQDATVSGRGFGMDAVRDIVERLGGEILLDSEMGKGTTFVFRIPYSEQSLIPLYGIFNLDEEIRQALPPSRAFRSLLLLSEGDEGERYPMFTDRLTVSQIFRFLYLLLWEHGGLKVPVALKIDGFVGQRRVDSTHFYRVTFQPQAEKLPQNLGDMFLYQQISEWLARLGGAMRLTAKGSLEVNIPSGIPRDLVTSHVPILLWMKDGALVRRAVEQYFEQYLPGFPYEIYLRHDFPESLDTPYILILDDDSAAKAKTMVRDLSTHTDAVVILLTRDSEQVASGLFPSPRLTPLVATPTQEQAKIFQLMELAVIHVIATMRQSGLEIELSAAS